MRLIEFDICIDAPDHLTAIKFDDASHFLINQMQAVDFVIETESHWLFIEIKDPDDPHADPANKADFIKRLKSGAIDKSLYTKYRDTWLYRYMNSDLTKPIKYIVLIAHEGLSAAELLTRQDALKKKIPLLKNKGERWAGFIESCVVLNIASWNASLNKLPVTRLSATGL